VNTATADLTCRLGVYRVRRNRCEGRPTVPVDRVPVSPRQAPVGEVKAPSGTGTTHPWMPRDSSGWLDGVVNCLHAAHAVLEDERVDGVLRLAAASDR